METGGGEIQRMFRKRLGEKCRPACPGFLSQQPGRAQKGKKAGLSPTRHLKAFLMRSGLKKEEFKHSQSSRLLGLAARSAMIFINTISFPQT